MRAVGGDRSSKRLGSPERPLSIVVLGNSMTFTQLPHRDPGVGTYGEVLRDQLAAAGVAANLHLEGRWFEFVHAGLRRYEPSVRAHVPDVLIIQYGLNESQPYLVPDLDAAALHHRPQDRVEGCALVSRARRPSASGSRSAVRGGRHHQWSAPAPGR